MDRFIERLQPLNRGLQAIQDVLDFDGWELHSQFATTRGLGRVALIGSVLGIVWGSHFSLLLISLTELCGMSSLGLLEWPRLQMASQWLFYVCSMSLFHLMEFFVTAIFNPRVTNSESFLVNHSKAYTSAFLISFFEFSTRFLFFPGASSITCILGAVLVVTSQIIRSWAMITCGESFNHLIQTEKKDNHILITHSIYKYLRHPSYVAFYYFSIATQVTLGNWISVIVFAAASLMFFRRRIPYEEEALMELFPEEYASYAKTTWIGIPFIPSLLSSATANGDERQKKD